MHEWRITIGRVVDIPRHLWDPLIENKNLKALISKFDNKNISIYFNVKSIKSSGNVFFLNSFSSFISKLGFFDYSRTSSPVLQVELSSSAIIQAFNF